MLIGELCQRAGVSRELVRHYTELGLLHWRPRSAGNRSYRDYSEDSLERLEHIQLGKRLGFSLAKLKPLLDAFDSGQLSSEQQCQLVEQQLCKLDREIEQLQQTREMISEKLDRMRSGLCTQHSKHK